MSHYHKVLSSSKLMFLQHHMLHFRATICEKNSVCCERFLPKYMYTKNIQYNTYSEMSYKICKSHKELKKDSKGLQ